MDLEGRGGGGTEKSRERGETIIRIYCTRKESVFNKRKEINNEANYKSICSFVPPCANNYT